MEANDMKLAWKELNEKVNASKLANKNTLTYILETQRKTALQKMMDMDKLTTSFLFLMTIVIGSFLLSGNYDHLHLSLRIYAVTILVFLLMMNFILYQKLSKIELNGPALLLYRQIASYKRFRIWGYFISFMLVIPFMAFYLIMYPPIFIVKVVLSFLIAIGVVVDYFIFNSVSTQIRTLTEATRELKELNGEVEK